MLRKKISSLLFAWQGESKEDVCQQQVMGFGFGGV